MQLAGSEAITASEEFGFPDTELVPLSSEGWCKKRWPSKIGAAPQNHQDTYLSKNCLSLLIHPNLILPFGM